MFYTLVVIGYGCVAVLTVPGLCCGPTEYRTSDGQCCPMCNEGTYVRRDCTIYSGTGCAPCNTDTFMNQPNGLNRCFPCTSCDSGHGLIVKHKCTKASDTVCEALSGFFCKTWSDSAGCSLSQKFSHCTPGQRIKEPGNSRNDTVCEDCQIGYFSFDGTNCTAWTICATGQVRIQEGTSSSDVVCASTTRHHHFLLFPLLPFCLLTLCLIVKVRCSPCTEMASSGSDQEMTKSDNPTHMMVSVEETGDLTVAR